MPSISHHIRHDVTPRAGFRRFEVITGERRRRGWTIDEKLAIVAESFSTTTSISDVARRHQINRNQLFQWRAQFRRGELGGPAIASFVPVTMVEDCELASAPPPVSSLPTAAPVIEVVIGLATVRVPPEVDDATLRRVLAAVQSLR